MKTIRLPIFAKATVKERLAHLGADVSERLKAVQLASLYCERLEEMPAAADLVGMYVGGNQMTSRRGLVFRMTGGLLFGFASFNWGSGVQ